MWELWENWFEKNECVKNARSERMYLETEEVLSQRKTRKMLNDGMNEKMQERENALELKTKGAVTDGVAFCWSLEP